MTKADEIIERAAKIFGIPPEAVIEPSDDQRVAKARLVAVCLLDKLYKDVDDGLALLKLNCKIALVRRAHQLETEPGPEGDAFRQQLREMQAAPSEPEAPATEQKRVANASDDVLKETPPPFPTPIQIQSNGDDKKRSETLLSVVSEHFELRPNALKGLRAGPSIAIARYALGFVALNDLSMSEIEVAALLECPLERVWRIARHGSYDFRHDEVFREDVEAIREKLTALAQEVS